MALLEIQVDEIEEDIIITRVDLTELEGDVNFLFDEQIIQDERLFTLEQTTDAINTELELIQTSILSLDFRVTTLEENGGDDGNSSVAELEVRVETLEGTAADHESRISTAEADVNGKAFLHLRTKPIS